MKKTVSESAIARYLIDVEADEMMPIGEVPGWHQKNFGQRPHPSSVFRWRKRGVRGVKLSTLLVGGKRWTSSEALNFFFAATTAAADGETVAAESLGSYSNETRMAQEFLAKNGM